MSFHTNQFFKSSFAETTWNGSFKNKRGTGQTILSLREIHRPSGGQGRETTWCPRRCCRREPELVLFCLWYTFTDEPSDIENLFDELEYPDSAIQVLSKVTPLQALWLARRTRRHVELGRENMADEIERELRVCMVWSIFLGLITQWTLLHKGHLPPTRC